MPKDFKERRRRFDVYSTSEYLSHENFNCEIKNGGAHAHYGAVRHWQFWDYLELIRRTHS